MAAWPSSAQRDGKRLASPVRNWRAGILKDYANTLILGVIASLIIVMLLGGVLEAVRATDEGVLSMQDHISFIRGFVCAQTDSDTQALFGDCWRHQEPGSP